MCIVTNNAMNNAMNNVTKTNAGRLALGSLPLAAAVVVGLALPAGTPAAFADSGFRCGNRIVDTGDHMYAVQQKCGEPDATSQRTEKRIVKQRVRHFSPEGFAQDLTEEREVEILIDEWMYDLGDRKFVRYVEFENNRVVEILIGARGSRR